MTDSKVDDTIAYLNGITSQDAFSQDHRARAQLADAAMRLLNRVQTPFERAYYQAVGYQGLSAAIRIVLDLGIFEAWKEAGGPEASLDTLVKYSKKTCDARLIMRLFRLMAAFDVVEQPSESTWKSTSFSMQLGIPNGPVAQLFIFRDPWCTTSFSNLPNFLSKIGYIEPLDSSNTNYMDFSPEGKDFFAQAQESPALQTSFLASMSGFTAHKVDWTEVYDTSSLVADYLLESSSSSSPTAPLMVDCGGAQGGDLMRILNRHPELPHDSLVLQDLPDVVSRAQATDDGQPLDPRIKTMGHDFFQPQPVKGSKVYFMHAVLHDWPDATSLPLLRRTVEAMRRGYSKLLLYEVIIPSVGATPLQVTMDMSLMAGLSARERTEEDWGHLLGQVGLEVKKIWRHEGAIEMVIEAELA